MGRWAGGRLRTQAVCRVAASVTSRQQREEARAGALPLWCRGGRLAPQRQR